MYFFFLWLLVSIAIHVETERYMNERRKRKKYRNWMGEQNRRERKYGVSYTILWLLQTESTRKTVRDSQLLTWREKVYLHGLSILCWYSAILKQHEYSSLNLMSRHFMLEKLDMRKFLGLISVVKLLNTP